MTLKSQSRVILFSPAQTGKNALVQSLVQALVDEPALQCHKMVGHARWASQSQDVSYFVQLQEQFNTNKLLALVEEAARPENARRLYIAVLTHISPAELVRYFAMPGLRFWPELLLHQGGGSVTDLIPYPPNFRLLGTMDTARFKWWDKELNTHSAVLQWSGKSLESIIKPSEPLASVKHEDVFLRACVRSTGTAYAKLYRILQGLNQPFLPLMQVLDLLRESDVTPSGPVIEQTIVFLANAWTNEDAGLFDD